MSIKEKLKEYINKKLSENNIGTLNDTAFDILIGRLADKSYKEISKELNLSTRTIHSISARTIHKINTVFDSHDARLLDLIENFNQSNLDSGVIIKIQSDTSESIEQNNAVEIILEIPEDATPKEIQEIIKQAATRADMTHRSYGGNGLTIDTVEILAEDKVLEPSGK